MVFKSAVFVFKCFRFGVQILRIRCSSVAEICIFEFGNGICDPIRVNTAFRHAFGAVRENLRKQINTTMSPEDAQRVLEAFHTAAESKGDAHEYGGLELTAEAARFYTSGRARFTPPGGHILQ